MPVILISDSKSNWDNLFNKKLIFNTLTDEHVLRILFMQKIKIAKNIKEYVTIYLDKYEIEDFSLNSKLYTILKYQSSDYLINIKDIDEGYDKIYIEKYSKNFP